MCGGADAPYANTLEVLSLVVADKTNGRPATIRAIGSLQKKIEELSRHRPKISQSEILLVNGKSFDRVPKSGHLGQWQKKLNLIFVNQTN